MVLWTWMLLVPYTPTQTRLSDTQLGHSVFVQALGTLMIPNHLGCINIHSDKLLIIKL